MRDETIDDLIELSSKVADAVEGLTRGDVVFYEDETPRFITEKIREIREKEELTRDEKAILQKIEDLEHHLDDIAEKYRDFAMDLEALQ